MALDQRDKDRSRNPSEAVKQSEEAVSAEEAGLPRDVYALLAQANLLRMRGGWDAAVQNCMAALRLAPDSSSAQSLLGDIYENQGRYDDAVQWYRMALDINPDSPADQMKLDRLLDLQSRQPRRLWKSQNATETPLSASPRSAPTTDTALRFAAITAAFLVLLVVVFAYVSIHRHAALASLGLASDQEVKTPVVVLPPNNGSNRADTPGEDAHDSTEQALLDDLRGSSELKSQGITIWNVQFDPRSAAFQLTYSLLPPANASLSRDMVLRTALLSAHAAVQAPLGQTATTITVRCLLASAGTNGTVLLIFVGDLSRHSLSEDRSPEAGLDTASLSARFLNPWWSSQIPN